MKHSLKPMTLKPMVLLNTRPSPQNKQLTKLVEQHGGQCIEFPLLNITHLPANWAYTLAQLNKMDCCIFTSQHAVEAVQDKLNIKEIIIPCIAIGQATQARLQAYGVKLTKTPEVADSEHLLQLDELAQPHNKNILLFKGVGGRNLIIESLTKAGCNLIAVDVYERNKLTYSTAQCAKLWQDYAINTTLLTSVESLDHAMALFNQQQRKHFASLPCIVLSQRIAQHARQYGIEQITIIPANTLCQQITRYYDGQ